MAAIVIPNRSHDEIETELIKTTEHGIAALKTFQANGRRQK